MNRFVQRLTGNSDEKIIKNSAYFMDEWYCNRYGIKDKRIAAAHYLNTGWREGFDPSPHFSTKRYLEVNKDVTNINPLLHYEKFGMSENRSIGSNTELSSAMNSIYFNSKWYREKYNISIGESAYWHYINIGWKLLYDPSHYFSTASYLFAHSDVARGQINPLLHYELYGKKELPSRKIYTIGEIKNFLDGLSNTIRKSELFDTEWYQKTYGIDDKIDAALHYLVLGSRLQYNPSLYFAELVYKRYYDLGSNECALLHYEQYGKYFPCNTYQAVDNLKSVPDNLDLYFNYLVKERDVTDLECYATSPKFRQHFENVDIIICVYNAYEDVKLCLESVFTYTSDPYHLIIVDDNSADLTRTYLEDMAKSRKNITLIRNTTSNHGYTYAANIGLRASTAEYVILLNSDTIVSTHWVDNMIKCAHTCGADLIGPLSNTASWQSIPRLTDNDGDWCHNVLPKYVSVHDMAKMVEESSICIYPLVPLLNGFCLMISRNTIDSIGYFDEENFGRGFAEEDDYTSRAGKAGLKLAIADDTYIFHSQSKSYSDAKRIELCKISGERLRAKHGREYIEKSCKVMYSNFVLDSIRYRTTMEFERLDLIQKGRELFAGLRILFLLPTSNASGGANVILQEALCMKKMGVEVKIMNLAQHRELFEKNYCEWIDSVIYVKSYKALKKHIKEFDLICCSLFSTVKYCNLKDVDSIPQIAYYIQDYEPYFFNQKGKEYYEAVNSYTLLPTCHNITKTTWNAEEVKKKTGAECSIIGPSVNLELFRPRKMFGNIDKVVITAMLRPMTPRRGPHMTIRVLREIALKYNNKVEINFFGCDAEREYESALFFNQETLDFPFKNFGFLSPKQTALLLGQTDIFVDFSTFQAMGLTAMEAMASGCATILTKYGGTKDFAKHEHNCLIIDTRDYATCFATVDALINAPEIRDTLSRNAYRDMCQFYPDKAAYNFLMAVFGQTEPHKG